MLHIYIGEENNCLKYFKKLFQISEHFGTPKISDIKFFAPSMLET